MKYNTIKQHEQIRVPEGWGEKGRAFIIQLERIFDDIYKRFGRLGLNDLSEDLRNRIMNVYPVGAIYTSVSSTDPGELFGGTWEAITPPQSFSAYMWKRTA